MLSTSRQAAPHLPPRLPPTHTHRASLGGRCCGISHPDWLCVSGEGGAGGGGGRQLWWSPGWLLWHPRRWGWAGCGWVGGGGAALCESAVCCWVLGLGVLGAQLAGHSPHPPGPAAHTQVTAVRVAANSNKALADRPLKEQVRAARARPRGMAGCVLWVQLVGAWNVVGGWVECGQRGLLCDRLPAGW